MRGERAQRIASLRDEGGEVDVADRGARLRVVGQGLLQTPDLAQRETEPPGRGVERRAAFRVHRFGFDPRRLALERVDRQLMVGRERGMAGGQELEAQMREIERADTQGVPDPRQHRRRRRRLADELDIALRRDQRIERVEQDADRGRQPQALSLCPRPFEQKRARRLQLLRKRRLLADRYAIGRRQILVGIKYGRDRAHVDREFADRFARHHPPRAGVGENRREQRKGDIGDAAARRTASQCEPRPETSRAGIPE